MKKVHTLQNSQIREYKSCKKEAKKQTNNKVYNQRCLLLVATGREVIVKEMALALH